MITRKKLQRLLGKQVRYEGTIDVINHKHILLINVCLDGKELCDHVWISKNQSTEKYTTEERISFVAEAYTYKDNNKTRKIGLKGVHDVFLPHELEHIKQVQHDKKFARRRR